MWVSARLKRRFTLCVFVLFGDRRESVRESLRGSPRRQRAAGQELADDGGHLPLHGNTAHRHHQQPLRRHRTLPLDAVCNTGGGRSTETSVSCL